MVSIWTARAVRIFLLAIPLLGLSACSLYESEGRKFLESDGVQFAKVAAARAPRQAFTFHDLHCKVVPAKPDIFSADSASFEEPPYRDLAGETTDTAYYASFQIENKNIFCVGPRSVPNIDEQGLKLAEFLKTLD